MYSEDGSRGGRVARGDEMHMSRQEITPAASARRLAVALLLLSASLALWWGWSATRAAAHFPHPGLNLSIAIPGVPGCDTRDGDATCSIRSGSAFPLYISIDSLPADAPQYEGFDLVVKYTGLTAQEDADAEVWPDCAFPAQFYDEGFIGIGCVIGVEPAGPSRYTGVIATSSFTCSQSGTISLVHSSKDTDVVETLGAIHGEGENTSEKLTISCDRGGAEAQEPEGGPRSQQPTQEPRAATQTAAAIEGTPGTGTPAGTPAVDADAATATAAAAGGPELGEEDGGGLSGWAWALIGVAIAAAVGLGVAGWRYAQRRRPTA